MKKFTAFQITLMIFFSSVFVGMTVSTGVYDNVKDVIVTTLCLSCIKMDPITNFEFTFEKNTDDPNPSFILENLTDGVVFLAFRQDVCEGCDKMEPVLKDLFDVEFEKEELFYQQVDFDGENVHFYHINLDHSSGDIRQSFFIYDQDDIGGVPMFVLVSLGNNSGNIEPYYTAAYATLGLQANEGRKAALKKMITTGINIYLENKDYYSLS